MFGKKSMRLGSRVEIIDGVLRGERATITTYPNSNKWRDRDAVWIRFDNDGAVYGREKGFAVLSQQWYEIDRLRLI